jgi:Domain of unknown function (DUF5666)
MRMTSQWQRLCASLIGVVAGLCASCGGEQTAGIEGSGAPVATSIVTTGRITGFGSIIVDGVEYATSAASIRIDEQPGTEAQLDVGDVVTIKGTLNADGVSGAATDVTFTADARGAVSQVDPTARTFVVLGQTVAVNDDTIFDAALQATDVAELPAGVKIQVSGFRDASETLLASRIDAATSNDLQAKGRVQALDTTTHTFKIDDLTVDYTSATVTGTLAAGSKVTARGTTQAASGALVASQVGVEPAGPGNGNGPGGGSGGANGNQTRQLEGVITRFASTADFDVDGQKVITDSSTHFDLHGATLGPNVAVKVHGRVESSGAILASNVDVKPHSSSGPGGPGGGGPSPPAGAPGGAGIVRGAVDSVSSSAATLSVLGVSATTSSDTALEDRSDAKIKAFRLSDVRVGDYVEVRGNLSGNSLAATLLKRDKPEPHSYLQGTAANLAAPTFTVLGVTITTNEQTDFKGPGGVKNASDFFSAAAGKTVKVRGALNGRTLIADQVQITK